MSSLYISYSPLGSSGGSGVETYTNLAAFPVSADDGALGIALDTHIVYEYNVGLATWQAIASPGAVLSLGAVGSTPNANAASITANVLNLQPADGTFPGVVTTGTQTIAGAKTFSNTIVGSISGNAATVTTNANLTGPITSTGNATAVASQTGAGSTFVMQDTPTLTTPVIGAATGTSLSVSGQLTSTVSTGTAPLVVSSTTLVSNLHAATADLASTVTTNANLTGPITSTGNATAVAAQTGSGSTFVMQDTPTLTTPVIGAATGTSLSVSGQLTSTVSTGTAPLVVASTTQVANLNAATAGSSTTATTATNLTGGVGGSLPYQSAASTTAMLANGTAGQVLTSQGTTLAPIWGSLTITRDDFNGDGSTVDFTLSVTPASINSTQVFISGVYQQKASYSLVGAILTFGVAPPTGTNNIEVMSGTLGVGVTPSPTNHLVFCTFYNTAHTADGNWQTITGYDAAAVNVGGSFNVTTGIFTAPATGSYLIAASIANDANATGIRAGRIVVDGSTPFAGGELVASASANSSVFPTCILSLTSGQTVELQGFQNSGGNLNYYLNYNQLSIARVS